MLEWPPFKDFPPNRKYIPFWSCMHWPGTAGQSIEFVTQKRQLMIRYFIIELCRTVLLFTGRSILATHNMFVSFVIFWSFYHLLLQVNVNYKQLKGRHPQYKRKVSLFFHFFPLLSCLCPHVKSPSYCDSKQVKSNIFCQFFLSNVCVGSTTNN